MQLPPGDSACEGEGCRGVFLPQAPLPEDSARRALELREQRFLHSLLGHGGNETTCPSRLSLERAVATAR